MLPSGFATIRDAVSFLVGLGFVVNEILLSDQAEPAALAIGAAMMGLPLVFGAEERKRGERGGGQE